MEFRRKNSSGREYMYTESIRMTMRTRTLALIAALALVALAPAKGQTKGELKSARKEAAAAARTLRRDGFKTIELGDVKTRLEKYFLRVNAGCAQVVGVADGCISTNLAQVTALANAANQYAMLAGGEVRGRIISSATNLSGQQLDDLVSSFERLVAKDIRGELVPYVTVARETKRGTDVRAYCIVDVDAASLLRRRALETALAEQALSEQYGSMVSAWINEGFDRREE